MRYEGGIRVPMIAAWAKPAAGHAAQESLKVPAGSHHDDLVSIADLFPTLLETAGVSGVPSFDGHDLRSALRGEPTTRPQWLVTHYPHGHNNDHFSIYHEGDWKFIRNHADGSAELYNLANDLAESANLAEKQPERAAAMSKELEQQLDDYGALRSKRMEP
jgi:arylsulfatase A-like enzyme